jgi:hypothetical protein
VTGRVHITTADLLTDLDQHPQHVGAGWDLEASKDATRAKAIRQVVTLPDGKTAERWTHRVARYAVAVLLPNDEIEAAHWEVIRWVVRDKDLPRAIRKASELNIETQTLEVTTP